MDKIILELFDKLNNEIIKYNAYYDKELIKKAFLFAYEAHEWIFRSSWEHFIIHPLQTAINLTRIEADEISIAWALLHDVCDNDLYDIEKIRKDFWDEIANIVSWVNKLWNLYYKVEMTKEEINDLKKSLIMIWNDIRIFLIKIADRLHNLKTLEYLPKNKRYRIAKETEEIYIPMVNFLSIWEFMSEFHDLSFKYQNEKEYKNLYKIFWKNKKSYEQIIIDANNLLEKELQKANLEFNITSRIKSLYSINKKMKSKNIWLSEITDILALRITTKSLDDCYIILWIIHRIFKIKSDKFKDYISLPKDNWYQSIHTTVYDNNSNLIEFQIQTFEMNKLNKSWIAAHFIYKWFWVEYYNMPNWMRWVLDIQKRSIDAKWFLEKLKDEVLETNIKCINHDWRIVVIPKNSVLMDFAFELWDVYWKYFNDAIINWNSTQDPFFELKDGDFIKIRISNIVKTDYKVENITLVRTQKARDWLKEIFNKYSKNKTQDLWKFLINSNLEIYSYNNFENLPWKLRQQVIKNFWLVDEKQMYLFVWLWIINEKKIFNYVVKLLWERDFKKDVSLKIFTKTSDFTTISNITNIFYNLNINITKLDYKQKKWCMYLMAKVESKEELDELFWELKRAPNVLNVIRVFSMRLRIYYLLFFLSTITFLWIFISINVIDLAETKTMLTKAIFFGSIIFMIFILAFLKYIVNRMLPDVLRYKRFWLSIFLLNTIILFIVFWELYILWMYFDSILYFIFATVMYSALLWQYVIFRRKIPKNFK